MGQLMYLCRNLEKEGCHPYIVRYKNGIESARKTNSNEIISKWTPERELINLDEICKKCESRFFGIKRKVCPVCKSKNFKEIKGFEFYSGEIKTREDSFVICKDCGTFSRFINIL